MKYSIATLKEIIYIGLNNYLLGINWIEIYEKPCINEKPKVFYEILKTGMDQFIPRYIKIRKLSDLV